MKSINRSSGKRHLFDMILLGTITGIALLLFAFAPKQQPWTAPAAAAKVANPIASSAQSIAAGKTIYIKNCNDCHGKKGKGDGPKSGDLDKSPKDFTKEAFQSQADGILFWKMTEGRKPMPSFKKDLTDEQRWQVINYVRTLGVAK
jgi:mono/diheme cytochrome c family protein